MKKSLLALLTIGAIAYSCLWLYSAGKAEKNVLKHWEEAVSLAEKQGYALTYKNIFSEGFPAAYVVKIQDPLLTLKDPVKAENQPLKELSLDGTIHFGSNLLGSKFWVGHGGTAKIKLNGVNSTPSNETHLTISGEDNTEIQILQQDGLYNVLDPFNKFEGDYLSKENSEPNFLIKNIHFTGKDVKVVNDAIPTLNIFEFASLDTTISFERVNQAITGVDIESLAKGIDLLIGDASSYIPGPDRSLQDIALFMSIPKSKHDVELKAKLKAPFEKFEEISDQDLLASVPNFDFDVVKLKLSSDFATQDLTSKAVFERTEGNGRKLHFDMKSQTSSNKAQSENLIKQWDNFLQNFPICQEETKTPDPKHGELCLLIRSLIPDMHKFGNIVYNLDLDFDTQNIQNPMENSQLAINKFDFVSDLYGFTSKGTFNIELPQDWKVRYSIDLLNYKEFLSDFFAFGKKIEKLAPKLNPELPQLNFLNEKSLASVTTFLEAISDEPNSTKENLTITLKVDGPSSFTVGTVSIGDFIQKWQQMNAEINLEIENSLKNIPSQKAAEPSEKEIPFSPHQDHLEENLEQLQENVTNN